LHGEKLRLQYEELNKGRKWGYNRFIQRQKTFSPDTAEIRPTLDRVKEAIFDVIQFRVSGSAVLTFFRAAAQWG
jgi:hypothetical protein